MYLSSPAVFGHEIGDSSKPAAGRPALTTGGTAPPEFPVDVGDQTPPTRSSTRRSELAEATRRRFVEAVDADPERRQVLLDEVVQDHLWLAETLSRRFWFRGEDADDLLQVARTGLVEACQRFDPDQGPFLAFAVPTIAGVLKRHFRDHGWMVRPPRRTQELASSIWQRWPDVAQSVGTIPSERQLADTLGVPIVAVRQARFASQDYTSSSLDATLLRGPGHSGVDLRAGEEESERCEARLVVQRVWARLEPAEQELLRMRFFEQRSQSDIATEIGTSQMQVSRLLTRLLAKLRGLIGALELPPAARQVA